MEPKPMSDPMLDQLISRINAERRENNHRFRKLDAELATVREQLRSLENLVRVIYNGEQYGDQPLPALAKPKDLSTLEDL
jgi:hypothetical protein